MELSILSDRGDSMRPCHRLMYPLFCFALFGAGILAMLPSLARTAPTPALWHWIMLAALSSAMNFAGMRLPEGPFLSASAVVNWAVLLVYGPLTLCPILLVSQFVYYAIRKGDFLRALANSGQLVLSAAVFWGVYRLFGGAATFAAFPPLWPIIPAFVAHFAVNNMAVSTLFVLRDNTKWGHFTLQVLMSLALVYPGCFLLGMLLAHAYVQSIPGFLGACGVVAVGLILADRYFRLFEQSREAHLRTLNILTSLIELRDPQTAGHSARVARYAAALGQALRLKKEAMEELQIAALLHDMGKLGVSEQILTKSGPLTMAESRVMRQHPVLGYDIAARANLPDSITRAIHCHHEHFDGKGYPEGLHGSEIPVLARMLTIADCFDAMTSDRAYRSTLTFEHALNEIMAQSGTQFDPELVPVFVACVRVLESPMEPLFKAPELVRTSAD